MCDLVVFTNYYVILARLYMTNYTSSLLIARRYLYIYGKFEHANINFTL